jgi:hypothetical protein
MLGAWAVAGFTSFRIDRTAWYCLFAMDRFYKVIVSSFVAFLAGLRADISLLRPNTSFRNENKKKNQRNE